MFGKTYDLCLHAPEWSIARGALRKDASRPSFVGTAGGSKGAKNARSDAAYKTKKRPKMFLRRFMERKGTAPCLLGTR